MSASLGKSINAALSQLGANVPGVSSYFRIAQVKNEYKSAIEFVYRNQAKLFLDHTNSVYITEKNDVKTLIVYMDESIFAADLNAQREIIKECINSKFNEKIELFEIHISRGNYKKQHPFSDIDINPETISSQVKRELSENDIELIEKTANAIDDPKLREVFKKAMTADLKRRN